MEIVINLCGFFGVWGLVSFPLYQAVLELSFNVFNFVKKIPNNFKNTKISPLLWIIPPLKIYKEKQRVKEIFLSMDMSNEEIKKLWLFLDKATAWFYVSLAGLLNAIYFTYDLYSKYFEHLSIYYYLIVIVGMLVLSIVNVKYRVSKRRLEEKYRSTKA